MAKRKPEIRVQSYGIYTPFDRQSDELPRILVFTREIPARVGVEFGFILSIRKARGERLTFRIDHPPFLNESGEVTPPFEGGMYVRANEYEVFLGDSVWAPVSDKIGTWTITAWLGGEEIAREKFEVVVDLEAE